MEQAKLVVAIITAIIQLAGVGIHLAEYNRQNQQEVPKSSQTTLTKEETTATGEMREMRENTDDESQDKLRSDVVLHTSDLQ